MTPPSTFAELGVPDVLTGVLAGRGITEPFPIQAATIPDGLAGRDVLGRAPTGSGKTLAFGIPVVAGVERAKPNRPRALILAPTRELAEQIKKDLVALAIPRKRWVVTIYGGVGYEPQRRGLRKGADIVVACPGRLTDLIEEGTCDLRDVDMVVIDEADRMADMGFLPAVRKLLDMTRADRQTWLFSATLDGDVAVLTRDYQRDPVRHEVVTELDAVDARHLFWDVSHDSRLDHTRDVIAATGQSIVFCRTRHGADRVAKKLTQGGVDSQAIHGGRSQNQRQRALDAFAAGRVQALVATDVAARGIHVDGVASVVHFDPTDDPKTYLHRSGRTARAGSDGVVVSMVTREQKRQVEAIQRAVGLAGLFSAPSVDALAEGGARLGSTPVASNGSSAGKPRRNRSKRGNQRRGGQRSGGQRSSDQRSRKPQRTG